MTTITIPVSREEAIAALVESDVARWGEGERCASQRMHQDRSYGLALNELANRAERVGDPDEASHRRAKARPEAKALRAAATRALTADDRRILRQGG